MFGKFPQGLEVQASLKSIGILLEQPVSLSLNQSHGAAFTLILSQLVIDLEPPLLIGCFC
jgi:hypothetical protein